MTAEQIAEMRRDDLTLRAMQWNAKVRLEALDIAHRLAPKDAATLVAEAAVIEAYLRQRSEPVA